MNFKYTLLISAMLFCMLFEGRSQKSSSPFQYIYALINEKNFFSATKFYTDHKTQLPIAEQYFIEAILDNAFGKLHESSNKVRIIAEQHSSQLPDSLMMQVYEIKKDNAVKLYQYRDAKEALEQLIASYKHNLSIEKLDDYQNEWKIWNALATQPVQKIDIIGTTQLKMHKDIAGLDNITVSNHTDSVNFIFDTGANLSTITKSTANLFKMDIIPADIDVVSLTKSKVKADLAVCKQLSLGNIIIHNAVFLVLDDKALSFPQINYTIQGIIGFPVIEALKEIQITQSGYFIIPEKETVYKGKSNLAMNYLTPLIEINSRHYTFDTGADASIFYNRFFKANQKFIEKNYPKKKIQFGGAGGIHNIDGYEINYSFRYNGKPIILKNVSVLIDNKLNQENGVYGNIGQDFIKQFNKMTINFHQMFIKFD